MSGPVPKEYFQSIVRNGGETLLVKGGKGDTPELGTHAPMYALWNGTVKPGSVSDTMIDFTDFYATFAELGGVGISNEPLVDGVSFASTLRGKKAVRRDWVQVTYTPYFGGSTVNRRFVRDQEYKLYADGRFYHIPSDLLEEKPLKEKMQRTSGFSNDWISFQNLIALQLPIRRRRLSAIFSLAGKIRQRGDCFGFPFAYFAYLIHAKREGDS